MLERHLFLPASPRRVWETLTDPEAIATWFGARVDWELSPGGRARFLEDDGGARDGRVDEVVPEEHLRFRWWPEGHADDGTSEVAYRLEPAEAGTNLTVIERPVPATGSPGPRPAQASALAWTAWDSRLVGVWGRASTPVAIGTR